jgi:hypothetical protein
MGYLSLLIWVLIDTLTGIRYERQGVVYEGQRVCFRIRIKESDKPLYAILEERLPGKGWQETQRLFIDKWSLPREVSLCVRGQVPGLQARIVLQGPTAQAGRTVVDEVFPWGEPALPPELEVVESKPPILQVQFLQAGTYLLRCYNRFGEEVFTIPLEAQPGSKLSYSFPSTLQGAFLIQLYDLLQGRVMVEKVLRL